MPGSFRYRAAMGQITDPGAAIRWGERLAVDLPVSIEYGGAQLCARMLNVSVSGALIETDRVFEPPVPVKIHIVASIRGRAHHMNLDAMIVRCADGLIGLEWRDMATQPLVELLQASNS
jgi:hypothetical protein